MTIEKWPMAAIKPYGNNAKSHPEEQILQIMDSIREFGNNDPIAIDEEGTIIEGHGRYEALSRLGYEEAEVIVLKGLTEDQKNAYRLVHNQLTMNSGWDMGMLEEELGRIEMDLADFGLDLPKKEVPLEDIKEVDIPEPEEEPKVKRGDLYRLGDHYLLCGDATSEDDYDRLMAGEKADLMVTDPPYNVNVSNSKGKTIKNDDMSEAEFSRFIDAFVGCASDHLKPGGAYYAFFGEPLALPLRQALDAHSLLRKQNLQWVKNTFTLGRQDYQWQHEGIVYGWKDGGSHYFTESRKESTVIEDDKSIDKMSKEELKEALRAIYESHRETTVIRCDKPQRDEDHPTAKPIKLIARLVRNSSVEGDVVIDPFCGSGSTLIACEQLNRRCMTMELDPAYCDVAIRRWEEMTGRKAERINER